MVAKSIVIIEGKNIKDAVAIFNERMQLAANKPVATLKPKKAAIKTDKKEKAKVSKPTKAEKKHASMLDELFEEEEKAVKRMNKRNDKLKASK